MSVRWTRTAQIRDNRVPEVLGWSKELGGWITKKHNVTLETWLDTSGPLHTVRWTVDYPDITTWERTWTALQADADWWRFHEHATKNTWFVDGATTEWLSRKV